MAEAPSDARRYASGGTDWLESLCGKPPVLSADIGAQLIDGLPAKSRVLVRTLGDNHDQKIGSRIQNFLEENGFDVIRMISRGASPRPSRWLTIEPGEYSIQVTVAPRLFCSLG